MNTKQQKNHCAELNASPLFIFSAGSKELFHSNFLYWLAIEHWDIFISIMRELANLENEHFWWEDIYKFEKENLEVRREYHNYDLSIYIQVNTKWVPVLILENKVKSLPYAEQLAQYV